MKLIARLPVIGLLFFTLTTAAWGQGLFTQFEPAAVNAPVGSTFSITLKVTGFTNICTFQLPVTFNKTFLELVSVSNLAIIPNSNSINYTPVAIANGTASTTGRITFSWQADLQNNPNGSTLSDHSGLFTLTFKVRANGVTTVNLANVSPGIEVTQAPACNSVKVTYGSGGTSITVGFGAGVVGFKIIANNICVLPGQIGCMPITVNDFTGVQSLLFATHWNPALLQFESVRNLNLPGWSAAGDFMADNTTGLLKAAWGTPSGTGVSRANGSTLLSICFKSITSDTTTDIITIDGNGFPAEAINDGGMDLAAIGFGVPDTVFINHCSPQIATAAKEPQSVNIPLVVFPNPFTETAQAIFELEAPDEVQLRVMDLAGRTVYEVKSSFPAGTHRFDVGRSQLNDPGAYFLSLQVDGSITVRPLFLQ